MTCINLTDLSVHGVPFLEVTPTASSWRQIAPGDSNVGFSPLRDRLSHLQSYGIVHGMSQRLLRPQVPLRGLDRGMAEEQLDLLQLPARLAAKFGAGPAQVVRRELAQIGGLGIPHH